MMKLFFTMLMILVFALCGCSAPNGQPVPDPAEKAVLVNPTAAILEERFPVPDGYERVAAEEHSFSAYLRSLPLKAHGAKVKYYNGGTKSRDVYKAVVDLDTGSRDLQQCADAVIRLRAEYLFQEKRYGDIHFNFTSGFNAEYSKWQEGYRVVLCGNDASWVKTAAQSSDYKDFRKYLDTVFAYAGTLSLAKELAPVECEDMQSGDVFIQGGSPGHCVIVVDMAVKRETGEKIFMLAQSYMPAQDIHILKNQGSADLSPWYSMGFGNELYTPEWIFSREDLKRFK